MDAAAAAGPTPISIGLRPLAVGDIAALQAIDQQAHGEAWSDRAFREQIAHDGVRHLVATDDGAIVGHGGCWLDGSTARITNVAVDSVARGRGVASALLCALLSDLDARVAEIRLEVRPTNRGAQRLYSRFGFAPVGIERNFYDRGDQRGSRDALVMAVSDPHGAAFADRLASLTPQPSRSSR